LSHVPILFALIIFLIGSPAYAFASLDHSPPAYGSGITGMCHHTQFFIG
jgi:hypothetical protein